MRAITVYCASSTHLEPEFVDVARTVGTELARRGISLVYGGGSVGLMGAAAHRCKKHGGHVVGIITEHLKSHELAWDGCDELVVVDTMRERKRIMAERGDGFLVLPGGIGTYEEFFEILVGRKLREHAKPIGVVNSRGYYNPLIAMIEHGIEHRFIKSALYELFAIDPDPITVLERVLSRDVVEIDVDVLLPTGPRGLRERGAAKK